MSNMRTSNNLNMDNLGPDQSLQQMYAKLQLEMADISKQQALDRMENVQELQNEQKTCAQYLNEARKLQAEAVNASGGQTEMPGEMADYMDSKRLEYDETGNDLWMSSDEWDMAVTSLEGYLEEVGLEVQMEMVSIQDFMGQYNSYLQGSNSQVLSSNQSLTSLARGQTMYGDNGTMTQSMYGAYNSGLTATTLVVGVVLGCLMTLFIQKVGKGKTKS